MTPELISYFKEQKKIKMEYRVLLMPIKVVPGIHDLQGREHMGQGLLFGQITI